MPQAERRHHRQRIITHRLQVLKYAWGTSPESCTFWSKPGRLTKYNLACGCWLCKRPRSRDQRASDKQATSRLDAD